MGLPVRIDSIAANATFTLHHRIAHGDQRRCPCLYAVEKVRQFGLIRVDIIAQGADRVTHLAVARLR